MPTDQPSLEPGTASQRADPTPRQRLQSVIAKMKVVDDAHDYYAFTLTADLKGNPVFEYQSGWVGQGSKRMRERRAASLVHPKRMRHLWNEIGQGSVVVTDGETMALYLQIGGNALIAEAIARQYLPDLLQPRECAPTPLGKGPRTLSQVPEGALNRAPTQQMRMDVLRRDGFRCQACGRRSTDNVDITLHVHHVRPFGDGGLTELSNLLTLCSTCHQGLKPEHFEMTLLEMTPGALADEDALNDLLSDDGTKFREGVRRYRDKVAALERRPTKPAIRRKRAP